MSRAMTEVTDTRYESADGWVMAREEGLTPNGNQYDGAWVLRDETGAYVDHNRYRYDLEARHDLNIRLPRQSGGEWQTKSFDGFTGKSNIP